MEFKTIILGAGAAGLMCAAHAGPDTLVIDHAKSPGEKIRISGGGRCNFTNIGTEPQNFLSQNPHFAKSALARYTQWDFVDLVSSHGIAWHEKTLGQLFCDGKATQIVAMLLDELAKAGGALWLQSELRSLSHDGEHFRLHIDREGERQTLICRNLVLATGGKSIPKMGATGLAYDIARQFGLPVTETRPALVPLTFSDQRFAAISGVSCPVTVRNPRASFDEALLFTHRGLSGPAILQVSSYWREGEEISVALCDATTLAHALTTAKREAGRAQVSTVLARHLPARLVTYLADMLPPDGRLADQSDKTLAHIAETLADWRLTPSGSEGYRTAEVTLGGIDTGALSSRDLEADAVPGLFAIGEAVDVTGWLGGYNFQWAWSSGAAAGRAIRARA